MFRSIKKPYKLFSPSLNLNPAADHVAVPLQADHAAADEHLLGPLARPAAAAGPKARAIRPRQIPHLRKPTPRLRWPLCPAFG